jgi:hypothetical protein
MSRTSSSQLKKEHEEADLPTAIAVEESKMLCSSDESTEYKTYLEKHKTKLREVEEAIQYSVKNHVLYRSTVARGTYDTDIDISELRKTFRDRHYCTRFMHSLYPLRGDSWFTKEERKSIQSLRINFEMTRLGNLEIHVSFEAWTQGDLICIHLLCCCCCIPLYRYYKR